MKHFRFELEIQIANSRFRLEIQIANSKFRLQIADSDLVICVICGLSARSLLTIQIMTHLSTIQIMTSSNYHSKHDSSADNADDADQNLQSESAISICNLNLQSESAI
jgi:hypothetical protein